MVSYFPPILLISMGFFSIVINFLMNLSLVKKWCLFLMNSFKCSKNASKNDSKMWSPNESKIDFNNDCVPRLHVCRYSCRWLFPMKSSSGTDFSRTDFSLWKAVPELVFPHEKQFRAVPGTGFSVWWKPDPRGLRNWFSPMKATGFSLWKPNPRFNWMRSMVSRY